MTDKMTPWGVGPRFSVLSVIYAVFILELSRFYDPLFKMRVIPHRILAAAGIALILVGIPFVVAALVTVMRAFNAGALATKGVYGMCRHPVYAGWVVFIVPGVVFLVNSWIALSIPLVMYFFLRIWVKKEEIYLEKTFGDEYLAYKKKVPAVLPVGWIKLIL
jgi:protein-S-isoprenylcysteine O-methyltransferase Ste14